MKDVFVETENVARFLAALKGLERRGAQEANLMVVDGEPGLGKSTTMEWWASQHGLPFLRCCAEWNPSWFFDDLLGKLHIAPGHAIKKKYAQALRELVDRRGHAEMQRQSFAVVIDEADHISRKGSIMESIRDLSDNGDIPFVLVGMGRLRDNLTRFPQISSRVSRYVKFEPETPSDVRGIIAGLCEVPVDDQLAIFVHRATQGRNREIMEAIANIEAFGKRNNCGPEKPVAFAAMAGQVLVNDRRTGQPIKVPGAF